MDFIKIETIKDWLFALAQYNDCYSLMFGKIQPPKFESKNNDNAIFYRGHLVTEITQSNTASIVITFLEHNKNLFTLIKLQNKDEYDTIVKIAEVIL